MAALKPPTALLIVEIKKERLNALVRFALPAFSASSAPHATAYMASLSPLKTAAAKRSLMSVTSPKMPIVRLATKPPMITSLFLP